MAKVVRSSEAWPDIAAEVQLATDLSRQPRGSIVTERTSSWVRRVTTERLDVYLKTYEYGTWSARFRDFAKRTAPWVKSRAHREFEALEWLRQHHLPAPMPLAVLEVRRFGFLLRALLATAAFPGQPANQVLPTLSPQRQQELAAAIGRLVGAMHAQGFRDRNLDLRNLLVDADGDVFRLAKIDSGRFVLRRPGPPVDALAAADWARLLPQLPPQLAATARAAATR